MFIRTNISSLWVIANQDRNLTSLNNVLCRMATGLRINKASDDAAGLAISEKLRVQVRGTSQAIRNVQNFQSLCKIEDGTLETANELLQRIRELCIQAASGTLTQTERSLIKTEVDEIMNELDRIGNRNAWLNTYPLDWTFDRPEVVAEGLGGAIPYSEIVQIFDAGAFQKYANRPVRITVVQDAATQELDTVALRSSHMQATLTGVLSRMTSRVSIRGTTTVSAPLTANFTSTANNPVDAVYRLVRTHDGVVIDPSDYQLSTSLPIPELTSFQATITNPSVTTFSATVAKFTMNATTGKARLGGGTGTILTSVQSDSYAERFLSDDDGLVTVSKNGVVGISKVQIYSGGSWIPVNESSLGADIFGRFSERRPGTPAFYFVSMILSV
jgi:flagellin-like hook-associated protein FlgL